MAVDTADTVTAGAGARVDAPGTEAPANAGGSSSRRFGVTSALAALLLCAFALWMASHPGAHRSTADLDTVVKLLVAAFAAVSCLVFGRRAASPDRLAWTWIGTFAAVWALGAAVLTWYDFSNHGVVPFPSPADAGFLAALPLAAIGVLLFSSAPGPGSRGHACSSTASSSPGRSSS